MLLISHILIACSSVLYTAYVFFRPSKSKLQITYALVAATLISGTYLVVIKPTHITQTCVTGLAYLAVMSLGIVLARNKLANSKV